MYPPTAGEYGCGNPLSVADLKSPTGAGAPVAEYGGGGICP